MLSGGVWMIFAAIFGIIVGLLLIVFYIFNIIGLKFATRLGEIVVRVIGIFIPPIGIVLGIVDFIILHKGGIP